MKLALGMQLVGVVASSVACSGSHQCPADDPESDAGALVQTHWRPNRPEPNSDIVFGTSLAGYHNATIWVYQQAMEELGVKVKAVVNKYPHGTLFPMFTGRGGTDELNHFLCKKEGCADKCEESGLGSTSPCVDFVADSNLPLNHRSYVINNTDTFDVIGTSFEEITIALYAPSYAGWATIDDAANALKEGNAEPVIMGFKGGVEDKCSTMYCPVCSGGEVPYIAGPPIGTAGYTYEAYSCPDFEKRVARKLRKKQNFLVYMWRPQVFEVVFPELRPLDLLDQEFYTKPNVGKALVRQDSRWKFSTKALSVLGAIFIGSEDAKMMDAWSHGYGLEGEDADSGKGGGKWNEEEEGPRKGGGDKGKGKGRRDVKGERKGNRGGRKQICDYESWDTACSLEAAKMWIEKNKDHPPTKGVWETFFW